MKIFDTDSIQKAPAVERNKTVLEVIDEFFGRTTCHGLNDAFRAPNWLMTVIWTLAIGGIFGYFVKLAVGVGDNYRSKPFQTLIEQRMSSSLDMPDFTICNFHRFNEAKLKKFNVSSTLADYLQHAVLLDTPYTAFLQNYTEKQTSELEQGLKNLIINHDDLNVTLDSSNIWMYYLFEQLGFSCSELFKYCVFGGKERNCCGGNNSVVTERVVTKYGLCYTVSTEPQRWPGYGNGLSVIVDTQSNVPSRISNLLMNKGVLVIPTEKTASYLSHAYGMAFFTVGTHSAIELVASKLELDPSAGSCYNTNNTNDILKSLKVDTDISYSVTVCQNHCKANVIRSNCGCIPLAPRGFQHVSEAVPYCNPAQIHNCAHAAVVNHAKELDECRDLCKPTCDHWDYKIISTLASLDHAAMTANRKAFASESTQDLVVLEFFYNSLQYSAIVHQRFMTLEDVIGVIGGQLSLCTGMSLLTFFQMGVYLCRLFIHAVHSHVIQRFI